MDAALTTNFTLDAHVIPESTVSNLRNLMLWLTLLRFVLYSQGLYLLVLTGLANHEQNDKGKQRDV